MRQGSTRQLLISIVAAATITLSAGQAQADKSASGIIDSIGPSIDSKFDNLNQSQKTGIAAGVGTTAAVGAGAYGILRLRQSRIRGRINAENNLNTKPAPEGSNLKPTSGLDESGNLRDAAPLNSQISSEQIAMGGMDSDALADELDEVGEVARPNTVRNLATNTGSLQDQMNLEGMATDNPFGQNISLAGRGGIRRTAANNASDSNEIMGEQTSGWNAAARSKPRVSFGDVEIAGNVDDAAGGTTSAPEVAGTRTLQNLGNSKGAGETSNILRTRQSGYVGDARRISGATTTAEMRAGDEAELSAAIDEADAAASESGDKVAGNAVIDNNLQQTTSIERDAGAEEAEHAGQATQSATDAADAASDTGNLGDITEGVTDGSELLDH